MCAGGLPADEWDEEGCVWVGHEEGSSGKHEQTEQVSKYSALLKVAGPVFAACIFPLSAVHV